MSDIARVETGLSVIPEEDEEKSDSARLDLTLGQHLFGINSVPIGHTSSTPIEDSSVSCSDYRIPRDYWACGSGEFSNVASENVLHKCKDELYFGYDLCCAIHDDCYDQLLGQNYCDSNFCECVQKVAKKSRNKISLCTFFAKGSCNAVKILGGAAYETSGNGSTKIYILKMNSDLQIKFFEIYQFCKSQYLTLNVCAMTYDFCVFTDINKEHQKSCLTSFSTCLESTNSTRLPNPSCDNSIENLQILIRKLISNITIF